MIRRLRLAAGVMALTAFAGAAASSSAGCALEHGDAFKRAFAEGERAKASGRYAEAADRYQAASKVAKQRRDADYAAYASAMTLVQAGDVRGAITRLDELVSKKPATQYTGKAAADAALLRIAHGEPDRGWKDLDLAMRAYPQEEASRSSLQKLIKRRDQTDGDAATLTWLDSLREPLGATYLGEQIQYERARHLRTLGRKEEARDAFIECAARWPYPFGAFFDNSLYNASELEEELGRPSEAVALLERMLREREVAHFMGSYQRPRYADALFRAAKLSEEKLGDRARARAFYHKLFADFTTSTLRDDAIWREAELWRMDGEPKTACSRLEDMVDKLPDSRLVPCAIAQCPGIERPKKSGAPKECRAYLTREKAPAAAAEK